MQLKFDRESVQKLADEFLLQAKNVLSYLLLPVSIPLLFCQETIVYLREVTGMGKRSLEGQVSFTIRINIFGGLNMMDTELQCGEQILILLFFQVVLITGASSGIGESLAKVFYTAGCKLILASRRKEQLERVKDELVRLHTVSTVRSYIYVLLVVCNLN